MDLRLVMLGKGMIAGANVMLGMADEKRVSVDCASQGIQT